MQTVAGSHDVQTLGSGGWTAGMTQGLGVRAGWVDTVSYMGCGAWDKSYREGGGPSLWVTVSLSGLTPSQFGDGHVPKFGITNG